MKRLRILKARRAVILAARIVVSSYEPGLIYEYDPDDLADLRHAVARLRELETPSVNPRRR